MESDLNLHDDLKQRFDDGEVQDYRMSPIFDLLPTFDQITFGIYTNFFAFLLTMLLIDGFFKIIGFGIKGSWKEAISSRLSGNSDSLNYSFSRKRKTVIYLMSEKRIMRIFVYALIFIFLQIAAGLCFLSFAQSPTFQSSSSESLVPLESSQMFPDLIMMNDRIPRILEEKLPENELISSESSPLPLQSDKISLSMGNIVGSLNLNVIEMILSKDKKIAYVTLDYYGTLKVIDISDAQSPFIIGSLNLEIPQYGYRIKNLLLSSDEKTLYASNSRELEIIDVTDPSSPKLISMTKSEIFGTITMDDLGKYVKTSMAVSESTKTLYVGGRGLQVYNISDPKKPVLLKASKSEVKPNYGPLTNEVYSSHDGQILFIANGTLDVYNISDPKEMKQIHSFTTESSPRSMLLSEDEKTVFLLGNAIFEEVDISDYDSLKVRNTIKFSQKSLHSPRFLAVSPSKSKFFVLADFSYVEGVDLLIFDRVKQTVIKNEKSLVENALALGFSADGRTLITASKGQFITIELFLDYPNSQIFRESLDTLISNFSLPGPCSQMQISNDGKSLFILRRFSSRYEISVSIFEIWDVKNQSKPTFSSSHNWGQSIKQMYRTKNDETVYLIGDNSVLVLDIKDRSSIKVKKTYQSFEVAEIFQHFTTSSDEKTGFLVIYKQRLGYVTFFDLSESSPSIIEPSPKIGNEFNSFSWVNILKNLAWTQTKIILKDDKTLILITQEGFSIYDVSNLASPAQIGSLLFGVNEPEPEMSSCLLSPDKKTLYIENSDANGLHTLRVYDVSVLTSPQLIGEKDLSKRARYVIYPEFSLSGNDQKSGLIYENNTLVKLNMINPKDIKISGIIPLLSDFNKEVTSSVVSPDGQTVYASVENQIHIMNTNIQYTLFLKQEKFLLGEKYTGKVSILNLTETSGYNLVDSELYKISKLSLLDMKVAPSKASLEVKKSLLPSWITFDSEGDILTVDAKKQRDIGIYTLCSTFSLKIPREIFKDLPVSSKDLWAWLISLGYVDNEFFLTANFGSKDNFLLPEKFENYTINIYGILKQFSFETCTLFEVTSSLEFKETNSFAISTLSTNNIKVEMKLESKNGSDVKFVSCPYGSIVPIVKNHNKTRISLEGSLKEINTALNSVIVNFENGTSSDANIVINDGFNPPVSIELANISRYFKPNTPPQLNSRSDKTAQEQIDGADIQTGIYFTFTLTNNIFEDENVESLDYEMVMAKNGTAFPTWLSFSGLTLKGTPPEEVLGRDIDLILIAKNEFKASKVPLRLHIKMSLAFYIQLVLRYIPYIVTIIGVLASANKIFNILGKRYYKHPKEFYLNVGDEISSSVIEPISFIEEELKQGELILKYLDKMEKNRGDMLSSLIDPLTKVLDKQKVLEKIQEAIDQMSPSDRQKLTRYPSPIIDKIIVNRFVLMQLELGSEVETKALFEKLEPDCMEVVERDSSSSLEFIINQNKLEKLIQSTQISSSESGGLEESLMDLSAPPGVNISLLKDVILALAFDNHTVDILPIDLDIEVKQKVPSNFLFRFLKLDLRDIHLHDKNKINYGINYQIIDDKLCFYGVTQNYFKGKTLVVQVKNFHHRIMKEIWIHGVSNDFQRDLIVRDEQEVRGQGYGIL